MRYPENGWYEENDYIAFASASFRKKKHKKPSAGFRDCSPVPFSKFYDTILHIIMSKINDAAHLRPGGCSPPMYLPPRHQIIQFHCRKKTGPGFNGPFRFTKCWNWNVEKLANFSGKWNLKQTNLGKLVNKFCQKHLGSNEDRMPKRIGYDRKSLLTQLESRITFHLKKVYTEYSFPCNTWLKSTNTIYFQFEQVKPVVFEDEDLRTNIATNQSWSSIHVHPQGENSWGDIELSWYLGELVGGWATHLKNQKVTLGALGFCMCCLFACFSTLFVFIAKINPVRRILGKSIQDCFFVFLGLFGFSRGFCCPKPKCPKTRGKQKKQKKQSCENNLGQVHSGLFFLFVWFIWFFSRFLLSQAQLSKNSRKNKKNKKNPVRRILGKSIQDCFFCVFGLFGFSRGFCCPKPNCPKIGGNRIIYVNMYIYIRFSLQNRLSNYLFKKEVGSRKKN